MMQLRDRPIVGAGARTAFTSRRGRIRAIVGDPSGRAFLPQLTLPVWGGLSQLSVRLQHDEPAATVTANDDIIVWETPRLRAHFYDLADGFEFEVHLLARPASPVLTFTLQHTGLVAHHQPALEPYPQSRKRRPAHVVDSYAFYHPTRRGDWTALGGQNYKAGKAFHLYRPWAQDANGHVVWCQQQIDLRTNRMTITLPTEFWARAVYPVLVDPTFGYTTNGASTDDNQQTPCYFFANTTPASSGTISSLTCHCHSTGAATNFDGAVYSDNAGVANTRLAFTEPGGAVGAGGVMADIATTLSLAITSGTQYWLGLHGHAASSFEYAMDAIGANASKGFQFNGSGTTFPSPALNGGQFNESATIWATFAAAGGTPFDWLKHDRIDYPDRYRRADIVPSGPMPGRGI